MTREHDIEELAVYIRHGLVKLKNHRPEFCDFAWANRDAMIRALSSLAAVAKAADEYRELTLMLAKSEWVARARQKLFDAVAALSSPAPEGVTGGDEVVP